MVKIRSGFLRIPCPCFFDTTSFEISKATWRFFIWLFCTHENFDCDAYECSVMMHKSAQCWGGDHAYVSACSKTIRACYFMCLCRACTVFSMNVTINERWLFLVCPLAAYVKRSWKCPVVLKIKKVCGFVNTTVQHAWMFSVTDDLVSHKATVLPDLEWSSTCAQLSFYQVISLECCSVAEFVLRLFPHVIERSDSRMQLLNSLHFFIPINHLPGLSVYQALCDTSTFTGLFCYGNGTL